MERIIISLFDRQKDYGDVKPRQKGRQLVSPSVALARHRTTLNTTRYVLLFQKDAQKDYERQARSLDEGIRQAAVARDREGHGNQGRRAAVGTKNCLTSEMRVDCIPVNYEGDNGVWDLATTTHAIDSALGDLARELGEGNFRLYVNQVNGTAEQRSALALWAYRMVQANPSAGQCFFACLPEPARKAGLESHEQLQFAKAGDRRHPFGFFQRKFNTRNAPLHSTLDQLEHLLGRIHVGRDDVILLTGPSGAGKTMVATMCMKFLRCLHPEIKEENCLHINMAAIPENIFESEFFGHCKGAFTGAVADKEGIVARAHGGILFLDEIGEMPLHLQAKLLTFLDTGKYRRVGDTGTSSSDFLLICGTNRDLEGAIPTHFRRDLYERINMWHFDIPGFHDRPEDLEPALRRELAIWNDKEKANVRFAPEVEKKLLDLLKDHPLEGNYRAFRAIIRRLATLAQDNVITLDDVNREFGLKPSSSEAHPPLDYDIADLVRLAVALDACKSAKNAREAGERLFAATRARSPSFNGSAYFQRIFSQFGLKVRFRDGKFDTIERI